MTLRIDSVKILKTIPDVPENPPLNFPKKRGKIEPLIAQYGWTDKALLNQDLLNTAGYCDFLDFLYDSKILYSIRGYETSLKDSDSELKDGIKIMNGQPHLLKEGQWTSWDLIIRDIQYDPAQRKFLLRSAQGEWKDCNYLYPNGLMPQTRYNWIEPVHQLNPNQMGKLYEHGLRFFKPGQIAPLQENCGFIQVFTAGTNRISQIGHVGLRMIDKNGKVYSLAFETPNHEANLGKEVFSLLATYNVVIASPDFKEFSKFDVRRTTTIPISEEKFLQGLEKVKQYAQTSLRFNALHQNCMTFALDILETVGLQLNLKTSSLLEGVYELIRPGAGLLQDIPCIKPILLSVIRIVDEIFFKIINYTSMLANNVYEQTTPFCIRPILRKIISISKKILTTITNYISIPIRFIVKAITFIPCLILTVIKNIAFFVFGAGKEGSPPKSNVENETNNSKRLTSFNRVFNNWTDFFKDEALNMSLPFKFVDWQMKQGSTETYTFIDSQFYIVPPEEYAFSTN